MKTRHVALCIIAMGTLYALVETAFFGWHFTPSCPDEILADGLALILCAIGAALYTKGTPLLPKTTKK